MHQRADGARFPVEVSNRLVSWEGRPAVLGIVRDITERRRAEDSLRRSEERYRLLHESMRDAFVSVSMDGRISHWNSAYREMLGYDDDELRRLTYEELTPAKWHEAEARIVREQVLARGHSDVYEKEYRRRDGSVFPVELRTFLVRDAEGRPEQMWAIVRDITVRRRAEEELRRAKDELERLNRELESRVDERTRQLAHANRELEAFAYSVSHDLRAPLRAITTFARVLEEDHGSRLDAEGGRVLGLLREGARRMGVLIDDLLAFSRASRTELEKAPVDVQALAASVWSELTAGTPTRARLVLGELPPAVADQVLLRQVLSNLLGNALKFSAGRDAPRVEVSGRLEDGRAVYSVRDNGVGFDMRHAHRLFGVFQRLHGDLEFEGTGVGLALVQRIVERHGGRVDVVAGVGEGATFSFSLPAEARA